VSTPSAGSDAGRVRLFGSLLALVFLVNFGRVVFAPLVAPLESEFMASEAAVGLVATLAWLGSALPRLPTGYLLTRVERHRVVLRTGLLLAVSSLGMTFAPTIEFVMLGALLVGLASGRTSSRRTPSSANCSPARRPRRRRPRHRLAAAAVVAPVLVGLLLARYDWRAPFWLLSAAALVVTAVIYVFAGALTCRRPGTPTATCSAPSAASTASSCSASSSSAPPASSGTASSTSTSSTSLCTKDVSAGTAQTLLTVVFAAGVPAFWYTGRLADRFRHVPLMLTVLGGFVLSPLAMTVVESVVGVALVSFVLGYAIHSLFPAIDTFLLDSLPDADRASAYAGYSGR